jgi:phytoene dehydrogenase-like protein
VLEAAEEIGGGARTAELTGPGLLHDVCSATHPMAVASPFLRSLQLERFGLEWLWPEVDLAHPLDDGSAGVLLRSIDETVARLGEDGPRWRRVLGPPSAAFGDLTDDLFAPMLHLPKHPVQLVRFGLRAATPASTLVRAFKTERARALFGGVAAHAFSPLNRPMSSSVGMALTCACHHAGWAVAKGGSGAITDALARALESFGGRAETRTPVKSLAEVPDADVIVFDLAPRAVADIAGDQLPAHVARAFRSYKHGPGAFKLDLAVEGGVPWTNEVCRRAGTVHLGGTFDEIAAAERDINRGRMPERPFVLVGQQYLADPSRSDAARDLHPIWTYAHVPSGYDGDATEAILAQLERFAPGVRERIVASVARTPLEFERINPNYVGGDIITGANSPLQIGFRPRFAIDPYRCGDGLYMCSAATPPGAGAHGMNGYNAARSALKRLRGAASRSAR